MTISGLPARIDPFEASGMARGLGLFVELAFPRHNTGFASSVSIALNIEIFARKLMGIFAMCFSSSDCSNGWFFAKKCVRKIFYAKYLLRGFAVLDAANNGISRDAKLFRPLCSIKCFFAQSNENGIFSSGRYFVRENLRPTHSTVFTGATTSTILTLWKGVFWCKFVTPFAMSFRAIFRPVGHSSQFKATNISKVLFEKGYFRRKPALNDSIVKCVSVNASYSGPFPNGKCFSFMRNIDIGFDIILLLFAGCPSAIFGRITLRAIDAVYRMAGWWSAHIRKEIIKIFPPLADSYASAAISKIADMPFVGASRLHTHPNRMGANYRFCIHDALIASFFEVYNGWL